MDSKVLFPLEMCHLCYSRYPYLEVPIPTITGGDSLEEKTIIFPFLLFFQ